MVIFNEIDAHAAEWLRRLSARGIIERGEVVEGDIRHIDPDQLRDAAQFHAFAGIGVWSYALRLAGWPADVPVWTGSCPCQPFSQAGKKRGFADERHLWPTWHGLIKKCRPPIVLGEQVASPAGRSWLNAVFAEMEELGYRCAGADLCAAGVGAPHIRQRLFWVAHTDGGRLPTLREAHDLDRRGEHGRLADSDGIARDEGGADGGGGTARGDALARPRLGGGGDAGGLGDTDGDGVQGGPGSGVAPKRGAHDGETAGSSFAPGATGGFWRDVDWLPCSDGKFRPVEPGTFPLAAGTAGRVRVLRPGGQDAEAREYNRAGALKGYGNAIVGELAAEFIRAAVEAIRDAES